MPIPANLLDRARNLLAGNMTNCADCVTQYTKEKPDSVAFIMYETGKKITWRQFETAVNAYVATLFSLGLNISIQRAWMLTMSSIKNYQSISVQKFILIRRLL